MPTNASVALWDVRNWQENDADAKKVGWFSPDDIGLVVATSDPVWVGRLALILCRSTFGWQGQTFFEVVT